jgi:hypothetical protein
VPRGTPGRVTPHAPPLQTTLAVDSYSLLCLFICQRSRLPCRSQAGNLFDLKRSAAHDPSNPTFHFRFLILDFRLKNHSRRPKCVAVFFQIENRKSSWWSRWDLNPRPPGCKPGALPTELRPPVRHRTDESECSGGPKWSRTTDLALIRGAL